ncbi:MAG TPA: DUF1847 domain-containing protein [Spirochaetota bacterium]|nr:DUF1847 domain-containing protein [Spirochaetota bacterium]
MNGDSLFTCAECGAQSCYRKESKFPSKCVSENISDSDKDKAMEAYASDGIDKKIALAAAEIEGKYYGKLTRVEEIIEFAKLIGAQKIGVASCLGLIAESRIFCRILKARGLEYRTVICKVGSVDKTEIGLPDDLKIKKGSFEAMCNPVLQAEFLNKEKTDLNVVVGLCVGHDSIFNRHSEAPVTTLIVKDRVLGHNPAAALYTSGFYYRRLLEER